MRLIFQHGNVLVIDNDINIVEISHGVIDSCIMGYNARSREAYCPQTNTTSSYQLCNHYTLQDEIHTEFLSSDLTQKIPTNFELRKFSKR